jgi:lipopolysaccharide export system permease protein
MTLTLGAYVARRFLMLAAASFLAVFALVTLVDLVELLGSNDKGQADFVDLLGLALLRAPSITITAAPFTVLLAAMSCFAWFARTSELVVTRAAGVSVWRLVAPALIVAVGMGAVSFAVYNPIAAALAERFDALESQIFGRSSSRLSVAGGGIWLRQGGEGGQTVIRASRASQEIDRLWRVSVFQFGPDDRFVRRIDARRAVLEPGYWQLNGARSWTLPPGGELAADQAMAETQAESSPVIRIPTNLTRAQIQESFAPPQTIAFWDLPGFIAVLEESGFSSSRHRLHWHTLLAAPAVYVAMVLVGAAFSMRHARSGGLGGMALGCVLTGFGYFFLSDVAGALGASGAVPVLLAAWGPPLAAVLLALGLLLHFEDG